MQKSWNIFSGLFLYFSTVCWYNTTTFLRGQVTSYCSRPLLWSPSWIFLLGSLWCSFHVVLCWESWVSNRSACFLRMLSLPSPFYQSLEKISAVVRQCLCIWNTEDKHPEVKPSSFKIKNILRATREVLRHDRCINKSVIERSCSRYMDWSVHAK